MGRFVCCDNYGSISDDPCATPARPDNIVLSSQQPQGTGAHQGEATGSQGRNFGVKSGGPFHPLSSTPFLSPFPLYPIIRLHQFPCCCIIKIRWAVCFYRLPRWWIRLGHWLGPSMGLVGLGGGNVFTKISWHKLLFLHGSLQFNSQFCFCSQLRLSQLLGYGRRTAWLSGCVVFWHRLLVIAHSSCCWAKPRHKHSLVAFNGRSFQAYQEQHKN